MAKTSTWRKETVLQNSREQFSGVVGENTNNGEKGWYCGSSREQFPKPAIIPLSLSIAVLFKPYSGPWR